MKYSLKLGKGIPQFWKPPLIRDLDCNKILNNNKKYINEVIKKRFKYSFVSPSFPVTCEDIKMRGYYPEVPQSNEEAEFPLAFAINIFHDYLKIEQYFLLMYAPQNHFCYAIDKKAKKEFKDKIYNLKKCFPNIYIVEKELPMDHSGVNGNWYNYECMKLLNGTNYKYLFIMEVLIWTLVNNISNLQRKVLGDERLNNQVIMNTKLEIQKGFLESAFPRETIDYIVNKLNITTLLNVLNSGLKFCDEIFWPSIMTSPQLQIPGWQHYKCSKNTKFSYYYYTRRSIYTSYRNCPTKKIRNGVCILGIETIHELKKCPQFFGNKFFSEFDAGGTACWSEYIYQKKFFSYFTGIDKAFYQKSPLLKYQIYKKNITNLNKVCDLALL
uniref:Uncharacterized protein n=1 Tax=Parastrongyloides trichosuri TaxID=131310 RepID=A0A0N5A6C4_PARTI